MENFVTGKLAKMGLGWEDCKKINPRLIYTSITGMPIVSFLCAPRRYFVHDPSHIKGMDRLVHMQNRRDMMSSSKLKLDSCTCKFRMITTVVILNTFEQNWGARPTPVESGCSRDGSSLWAICTRRHHGSTHVTPADWPRCLDRLQPL